MSKTKWRSCAWLNIVPVPFPLPKWIPESIKARSAELGFPRNRIKLSCTPTNIEPWITLENGHKIFIKRDDQTGSSLSGNKVRKLEFIIADALMHRCDTVITCGGIQSNHCRAVAAVAAQLNMKCHLVLRSDITDLKDVKLRGNLLLDHLCGASCYLVGPKESYATQLLPRMQRLAELLRKNHDRKPYIIPVGGSDAVGVFGYFGAFDEILQSAPVDVLNIFVACGSGGTLAGLSIANYLCGHKFRIYGLTVCDNAAYFYEHVQKMLEEFGLGGVKAETICHVIDGYKGLGYGLSTPEERELIAAVGVKTGILLDPVYTGKAVRGMLEELESGADVYEGSSLFIHTGGIFGIFGESQFEGKEKSGTTLVADTCLEDALRVSFWKDSSVDPRIFALSAFE